jgi:hypothetical protein
MKIKVEEHQLRQSLLYAMKQDRQPWWEHWRTLADYYLPNRYQWLQSPSERQQRANNRNSNILDNTGTKAARTLAAGMMNGITSPARPWFKLRVMGMEDDLSSAVRVWLDDCERRMLKVFSESNFYNALSTLYLDLVVFGTAEILIYEDTEKVIHCTNPCLGEFYLMIDPQHRVCGTGREFTYTVYQAVTEFGLENCSESVQGMWKQGGANRQSLVTIAHLIEPNSDQNGRISGEFRYRETYWEVGGVTGEVLRERGYYDFPGIAPRWELAGNDAYGTSPAMDALGDVIQLQHETKKKAQALDKLVSPPILADIQLEHKPLALLPNGVTYVSRLGDTQGAKPVYTVNPPLQDMTQDLIAIQSRIQQTFHNDLFNRVLSLQTVRSAREIDAIDSERLVLLGPVLQRFENEALDPAIERTFGIMMRGDMFLPPPEDLQNAEIKIQYVSLFAAAQNAVTTAPTERFLQVIGNLTQLFPEARLIPNIPVMLPNYGRDIGVRAADMHTAEEIKQMIAQQNEKNATQEGIDQTGQIAQGAQILSQTEVGGGQNALQRLLSGGA